MSDDEWSQLNDEKDSTEAQKRNFVRSTRVRQLTRSFFKLSLASLDQISHIHGHLIDLCTVVLFNISKNTNVIRLDKVDGNTLSAKTTRSTDSVDGNEKVLGHGEKLIT